MKTKQIISITGFSLLIGYVSIAQSGNEPNKREKVEAHKIAFLTQKLDLTPAEAQAFWPVYNQCRKENEGLRKNSELRMKKKDMPLDEMSDEEVEKMVDNELVLKQKELDLQKACLAKYKEVLPIKKVAKLYHAERQFKRELLRKMQQQKKREQQQREQGVPPDRW